MLFNVHVMFIVSYENVPLSTFCDNVTRRVTSTTLLVCGVAVWLIMLELEKGG